MSAYSKFKNIGIYTPMDVSRWASERGLLGVHIVYVRNMVEHAWEIRRYGMLKGTKAISCISGKSEAEDLAKDWASAKYGVDFWCRIEGMGNALFPLAVAEYVKEQVGVSYRKRRQHS